MLLPGGGVELEREDDVVGVADLTDEAALRAQVTVKHVVGGELCQLRQVHRILTIGDLEGEKTSISTTHTHTLD